MNISISCIICQYIYVTKQKHHDFHHSAFAWLPLVDTLRMVSTDYDERRVNEIKEILYAV